MSSWTETCRALRKSEGESLADYLDVGMGTAPDKPVVIFEGKPLTYQELDEAASRIANGLVSLGVNPGDRVAIHFDNRPEFIMVFLGVMRAGAILVPTNVMYTAEEMDHILTDSGAKVLFVVSPLAEKLSSLVTNLESLSSSVELGEGLLSSALSFDTFVEEASPVRPEITRDPENVAIIQYTSGTTGKPKGAMVSDNNILAVLRNTTDLPGSIEPREDDATLLTLPLFHAYALDLVIGRAFQGGQTLVLMSRFDAEKVFQLIEKHRCSIFYGAPPMYHGFVNTPGIDQYDVSSLRACFCGAAPLPVVILERFLELSGVQISEGYGLSETSPTLSNNSAAPKNKPGSVGFPIREVSLRIVDEEDNDVAPGEVGEIIAQGPNVFKGYWQREKETAEAMRGGWFHTGDLGRVDEEGYYFIVDRKKDMIVVSGYNVYPIEIENVIMRHPNVQDCAVIGLADDYQGESVRACVVLNEGESLDADELIAYCREHLAAFKCPRSVSIRETLPKNPTGKILKRELRVEEST